MKSPSLTTSSPDLLRALRSDSPEERDSAFGALFGNVVHQGTVYAATPLAVPFIIELLSAPDPLDAESLVLLLAAIAEAGFHLCAGDCVPNDSVFSCGSSCAASPVPPGGFATCDGLVCGMEMLHPG